MGPMYHCKRLLKHSRLEAIQAHISWGSAHWCGVGAGAGRGEGISAYEVWNNDEPH